MKTLQEKAISDEINEQVRRLLPDTSSKHDVDFKVVCNVICRKYSATVQTNVEYDIKYTNRADAKEVLYLPSGMVPAVKPEPGYVPKEGEIA